MNHNENDKGNHVLVKTYEGRASKEIAAEYNLPDYLPDINRLLKVSAEITEESRYLSGDTLEYDGKLRFSVLYATSDGRLKNATFDTDFSGNTSILGTAGDCDIHFTPAVESVSCRLQNPRRLTAKAKLSGDVSVIARTPTAPMISGRLTTEEENALQYRTETVRTTAEADAEELGASVSEDIELDASMTAMEDVIAVELTPFVSDARVTDGKVTYKGEVMANILYLAKGDATEGEATPPRYVSFVRSIPVSGEILSDALCEGAVPTVSIRIDNTEFRPRENAFGENRTVEIDFDYSVFVHTYCCEENEVVTDMYSVDYESTEEREPLAYETVLYGRAFNFSVGGSTARDDKDFDMIVGSSANAVVESAEKEGNKLIFNGHADVSVILTNGAGVYQSRSFAVPFRAETDGAKTPEAIRILSEAFVMSDAVRMDDGNLYADLEILIPYVLFERHTTDTVRQSAVYKDKPTVSAVDASLTLYYPTAGEPLWDIAKKYRTTVSALQAANGTVGDTASSVMVIPKRENKKPSYSKLI